MRYIWIGLCALGLAAPHASAQDAVLDQQYSQVKALNDASWKLIQTTPRTPANLAKAAESLKQSLALTASMQPSIDDASKLSGQMEDRRVDALLRLAKIHALLGERAQALDELEQLLQENRVSAAYGDQIAKDADLAGLHDDPRYQAVLASLKRESDRWNAPSIATPSPDLDEAQRIAGLSLFWSEARYNFAYFDRVPALDWNQAYLDFLPKVIAAHNLHNYYDVLMRFAPLLKDGHTNIYPPQALRDEFYATPALETRWVDGHVMITDVLGADVAAASVRVGDEIVSIDGEEVRHYVEQHVLPYESSSTPKNLSWRAYTYRLLDGDYRQPVRLGLLNAAGRPYNATLQRKSSLPASSRRPPFEWRMLKGDIAYLAMNEFRDDADLHAFEQHLPQILKARGLILDVRYNGGGSSRIGLAVLSYLVRRPIPLEQSSTTEYVPTLRAWNGPSTTRHRLTSPDASDDESREQHYDGPVVVLIGQATFSAAEDFVVSFDAMKRGPLIGEATGGSTGQPLVFNLPGGGMARICTKRDTYPDGRAFVGTGIAPNIEVAPAVADIRAHRDPALEQASETLRALAKQGSP